MPASRSPVEAIRWSDLEPRLQRMTDRGLIAVVRDLFDLSEGNRVFLAGHLLPHEKRDELLSRCRHVFEQAAAAPQRRGGREVRHVLRGYVRATGDHAGAALLLAPHLRRLLERMNEDGARRPGGGFTALLGDLARLLEACGGTDEPLRRALADLEREAQRVSEELGEWVRERIRGSRG